MRRKPPTVIAPLRSETLVRPVTAQVRAIETSEAAEAVHLLLQGLYPAKQMPMQVERFFSLADQEGYDLSRQMVVTTAGRLAYACLFVPRPGRMGYVFTAPPGEVAAEAAEALGRLNQSAFTEGSRFVQILLEPDQPQRANLCEKAGYRHMTDLIYLGRRVLPSDARLETPMKGIDWLEYDNGYAELFQRTIAQTYQQSLDCPELGHVRSLEDTFDGFLKAGGPELRYWRLLCFQGEPAGVLLLTRLRPSELMELTYMGVCSAWRRRGLGRRLLEKALAATLASGADTLTLAVDYRNSPARRLYREFGFNDILSRQVYYSTP